MTSLNLNPRYANYCRAMGNAPQIQLEKDRKRWPGGSMVGFVRWNTQRLWECSRVLPQAFFFGRLVNHDLYDFWLTRYVDWIVTYRREERW